MPHCIIPCPFVDYLLDVCVVTILGLAFKTLSAKFLELDAIARLLGVALSFVKLAMLAVLAMLAMSESARPDL
ncbi:hypothetical protein GGX14DRAFT_569680 [Mycena pura]|uniref:Uncharacterized protein n=1 Tax=Mycena pura TaxID=153505 RepID=A0AAD6V760_9AGAR|nr:hypothetical protein GGX14DRAFT_569680 [Mycena pura]